MDPSIRAARVILFGPDGAQKRPAHEQGFTFRTILPCWGFKGAGFAQLETSQWGYRIMSLVGLNRTALPGLGFVALLSAIAFWFASLPAVNALSLSPLIFGILIGGLMRNVLGSLIRPSFQPGIIVSAKLVLRLAIILYGFRLTFGQIADVGVPGLFLDLIVVSFTLIIGTLIGVHLLGMDKDLAVLTSVGAAVCGAAAVVATEPVVRSQPHKTSVAVGTVVLFGTLSMFLYPIFYSFDFMAMPEEKFGVYIGATVHEVAHVVGAGGAIGPQASDTAVIVKMTRVILLVPTLVVLGWFFSPKKNDGQSSAGQIVIPWFAVGFLAVIGFNSLGYLDATQVDLINRIDHFLLTMAMTALGLETRFESIRSVGSTPVLLAFILFVWLVIGGYGLTHLLL